MKQLLLCLLLALCAPAAAHEIRPAVVDITLGPANYRIEIAANVEALLAGVSPAHRDIDESPNARRYDELRALPAAA